MSRKHPDALRGECGVRHPKHSDVFCRSRPGDNKRRVNDDRVHVHYATFVTNDHPQAAADIEAWDSIHTPSYGERTTVKWIEVCGKRHQDDPTKRCDLPRGHKERAVSRERSKIKLTTKADLEQALVDRHKQEWPNPRLWVYVSELRVARGLGGQRGADANNLQRIDGWAIKLNLGSGHLRVAYEIKVDRQDFKNEIANPAKRQKALDYSNQFYFVVPKGLVSIEEVPDECGLMEFNPETKKLRIVKSAPHRESLEPTWSFVASLASRL